MVLEWAKKIIILAYIIAFYKDNDIKLKFVRGKKVYIFTKEANAERNLESKPKKMSAYFLGHHVIQNKMFEPFYKKIIFLQNVFSLKNQPFLSTTS